MARRGIESPFSIWASFVMLIFRINTLALKFLVSIFFRATVNFFQHLRNVVVFYNCVYYLLHESECDMAKYFTSRLIYFHEPEASENKA